MTLFENVLAATRERQLVLNPVLSPGSVAAFEASHSITLPDDYREFLLRVGNGGAGPPAYGLLPLGDTTPRLIPEWFATGYKGLLDRPFFLTDPWVWEDEPFTDAREASIDALRFGNLCLGTDGCGLYWLLIITGKERGQVWQLADVGVTHLVPRLTFIQWYEYWLQGGDDWFREYQGRALLDPGA